MLFSGLGSVSMVKTPRARSWKFCPRGSRLRAPFSRPRHSFSLLIFHFPAVNWLFTHATVFRIGLQTIRKNLSNVRPSEILQHQLLVIFGFLTYIVHKRMSRANTFLTTLTSIAHNIRHALNFNFFFTVWNFMLYYKNIFCQSLHITWDQFFLPKIEKLKARKFIKSIPQNFPYIHERSKRYTRLKLTRIDSWFS